MRLYEESIFCWGNLELLNVLHFYSLHKNIVEIVLESLGSVRIFKEFDKARVNYWLYNWHSFAVNHIVQDIFNKINSGIWLHGEHLFKDIAELWYFKLISLLIFVRNMIEREEQVAQMGLLSIVNSVDICQVAKQVGHLLILTSL